MSADRPTILTAEQVRTLVDLALKIKGTDDPKALEIVADDLSDAVLTVTGWHDRLLIEYTAASKEGRPLDWNKVDTNASE